jgi:pheromone shutdown-related protein TraB
MHYKNLYLLGTSHISKDSIKEINDIFENQKPDIVAVELDKQRYLALSSNQKPSLGLENIFKIGLKGYLFMVIGHYVQQKLGHIVKVKPGSDMIEAVKLAKKNKVTLELIDQDINITLKKFSKYFSWKEKFTLLKDIFQAFFFKKTVQFDISKVPEKKIITKMIDELKIKYPNIYFVLIEDRNNFMAKKLFKIMRFNPSKKIFCVVGAGHEEGMIKKIKELYSSNISFHPDS